MCIDFIPKGDLERIYVFLIQPYTGSSEKPLAQVLKAVSDGVTMNHQIWKGDIESVLQFICVSDHEGASRQLGHPTDGQKPNKTE